MARGTAKKVKAQAAGSLARQIAARRGGAGEETSLDRLVAELGEVARYDIVAALKELEKAGAGTFEVGRTGRKARFRWSDKVPKLADKAATDRAVKATPEKPTKDKPRARPTKVSKPVAKAEPVVARTEISQRVRLAAAAQRSARAPYAAAARPVEASAGDLEHAFHLRPGFVARIRLPSDVTGEEVQRFCQFLQAIPFASR